MHFFVSKNVWPWILNLEKFHFHISLLLKTSFGRKCILRQTMPTVQVKGAITLPDRILLNTYVSVISVLFNVQFPSWSDHATNKFSKHYCYALTIEINQVCYDGNSKTLFLWTVNRSSNFFVRSSGLSSEWYGQLYILVS